MKTHGMHTWTSQNYARTHCGIEVGIDRISKAPQCKRCMDEEIRRADVQAKRAWCICLAALERVRGLKKARATA